MIDISYLITYGHKIIKLKSKIRRWLCEGKISHSNQVIEKVVWMTIKMYVDVIEKKIQLSLKLSRIIFDLTHSCKSI